jgi:hypothetical protein
MDAYFHEIHDFAPTEAFDPSLTQSPEPQVISSPVPPVSPVAGSSPASTPVRAAPSSFPHTPRQQFQQLRPQVAQLDPMQFRQLLEQSGRRRPMPMSDAPLSPMEMAAQRLMADPQQSLLSEYYKSMDKAMDDVMQIVKGGRR